MNKRALVPAAITFCLLAVACGSAQSFPVAASGRSAEIRAAAPAALISGEAADRPELSAAGRGAVRYPATPDSPDVYPRPHGPRPPTAPSPATAPRKPARPTPEALAVQIAITELGKPYVWGAVGPWAFDCSGLVQYAYRGAGIRLPRTTWDQIHVGRRIPLADIQPGDLVFYVRGAHVALYAGGGRIIQAPHPGARVEFSDLFSMNIVAVVRPY